MWFRPSVLPSFLPSFLPSVLPSFRPSVLRAHISRTVSDQKLVDTSLKSYFKHLEPFFSDLIESPKYKRYRPKCQKNTIYKVKLKSERNKHSSSLFKTDKTSTKYEISNWEKIMDCIISNWGNLLDFEISNWGNFVEFHISNRGFFVQF